MDPREQERLFWPKPWLPSAPSTSSGRLNPQSCYHLALCSLFDQWTCIYLNSVKGPELLNMYVGQSEENIRNGIVLSLLMLLYSQLADKDYALLKNGHSNLVQCLREPEVRLHVWYSLTNWILWPQIGVAVGIPEESWTGNCLPVQVNQWRWNIHLWLL